MVIFTVIRLVVFFSLVLFSSCTILQNNAVVYRLSRQMPDTAHVYSLPFAKGTSHQVWQGYHSLFSHWGNYAIDFRMKRGTVIHAARGGVVVGIRDEYKWGGVGRRYVGKENALVIRHSDSTYAHYLHIRNKGALVKLGDTVQQGQPIAISGSTGFSAFPHLHFEVTGQPKKASDEVPVWFQTEKGVEFLHPLRRYTAQ
jgi:murein DD-endopeptidase MepM/ murein hydrolase activator NlpD